MSTPTTARSFGWLSRKSSALLLLKPALVILDVWLPKLNGLEVARQLKSNPATCTIPIIWITADVRKQKQALRVGAAGFIEKPFDIDEVADTVQSCLEQVGLAETA